MGEPTEVRDMDMPALVAWAGMVPVASQWLR